ncbi:UNVERIFIED_CONTAM: hypothetical protein FKN15_029778 [Acipenser sinensis]
MQLSGSRNGVPEFKELSRKSSALLNFQRHPELLEPYDPKKNTLNLGGHHGLPATTSAVTETENKENKHWSSLSKSSSPLNVQVRSRTPDKSKPEKNGVLNSTPPYQEKPASRPPSIANEPVKLPSGSLSSVGSSNSSLDHRRPRPDIVSLRRQDSSGPVLETSRSRRSSASSTSVGSLQNKLCLEDQEDALYAENVNRHGNRRYIPFLPGTGRDIDTGSIPAVDDLIDRFDGKESPQRRGRSGRRNRINAEDRKRSRSVDSALPFGLRGDSDYLDDFSRNQGRSTEHLLKPSQLRKQKSSPEDSSIPSKERQSGNPSDSSGSLGGFNDKKQEEWHSSPSSLNGQDRISSTYGGNKTYLSRSSTLLMPYNGKGTEEKTERSGKMLTSTATTSLSKSSWSSVKKPSSERDIQATPDLLKGQQALSQQTNEETAKQILFNYLKDGSTDNDDTTKKKVNLVFEKIQTLKSRAAGSVQADNKFPDSSAEVKALQEKQTELEKQVTELKRELEQETKNQQSLTESNAMTKENMKDLQKNLEESLQESNRLREQLAKAEKEHRATIEDEPDFKMESYAVGDVPNNRMQQDYLHFDHTGRSQIDRAGTYGVSIRVQGIDGHPYVVLNNRNGQSAANDSSSENGYSDSYKNRSFLDNYDEHDFNGRNNDEIPRPENPFVEYRSQKQMQLSGSRNGVPEFKELSRKSSALLNFQRHPELLEPYDPKKNTLNLGGHHGLPVTTSAVTETENKENKHWSSLSKSSSPLNVQVRSRTPDKSKPEKNGVLNSTPPYQEKPASRPPSIANEPVKLPSGSLSSVGSSNSSLDHRRPRPDIVPLRRQDSSGPVLETSRSRRSSASSTSVGSLQNKLCLEDQEDALYAENVNRHGNRRYIPFLPGTGRDIDTGSIPAVDDLIDRFDGKESPQRRGRSGRRNRINAEDRKRSRSVDSALPFGLRGDSDYLDDFSRNQGRSTEHLLKPSQLRKQKSSPEDSSIPSKERQSGNPSDSSGSLGGFNDKKQEEWHSSPSSLNGQDRISSTYGGNKTYLSRSSTLLMPNNGKGTEEKTERSGKMLTSTATTSLSKSSWSSVKKPSSERDIQATPDLLKGQQALSQQTNEETAKQILFNYLKDGLYRVKMEREQYQNEIRDLQDQLSEMHDELDSAKRAGAEDEEKDALTEVRSRSPDKSKPEKNGVLNSTPPPYQEKPASRPPSIANEPVKLPSGSLSSVGSTNSSLDHRRPRPDIVPLRRQDSSGPVLETSRSRRSSASSTSVGSLQNKLCLEDQEDALYAENVNRHGNRRYIPFLPGTGRDIDTGSIPAVDDLIDRFDGKESPQRRGRSGRRNRINAEDRKRSRSVDSALPFGLRGDSDYLDDFSRNQGRSTEHLLKPSQLRKQKSSPEDSSIPSKERQSGNPSDSSGSLGGFNDKKQEEWHSSPSSLNGQDRISSTYGGNKTYLSRSSTLLMPYNGKGTEEKTERSGKMLTSTATTSLSKSSWSSVKKPSSERDIQATPDLLKGQQALSQQTNEETAKQILFNYLKDGSTDNDDTTKKKVNLVFEKIQTLKSRAAGSVQADNKFPDSSAEVKALQEKQTELEKQVTELKRELEQETKNQQSLTESNAMTKENMKDLQKNLEESLQESNRLREQLAKAEKEHRATIEELYQVKMEREQYQNEIRDLQDQLSEMHDELDSAKRAGAEDEEKDALTEDSSGPVLETSRSRRSSASSTSVGSLQNKLCLEDQEDALYAENVNRHGNRRYIPFLPGTGRDIDTGSIPAVDDLIDRFDGKESPQRRGRSGRRNRINAEDRKRSRSVDSALPFGLRGDSDYLDDFSRNQGRSTEHLLKPSQLRKQKSSPEDSSIPSKERQSGNPSNSSGSLGGFNDKKQEEWHSSPSSLNGQDRISSTYGGNKTYLSRSSTLLMPYNGKGTEEKTERSGKMLTSTATTSLSKSSWSSVKKPSSERDIQATPDLLKGQQALSQQTNEETAKQILFNYLKDGSTDNDDTTKKKVNLVFEKIQTLKSRAAGSVQADNKFPDSSAEVKALQEKQTELEKQVTELKRELEQETKNQQSLTESNAMTKENMKDLQKNLEESLQESNRLREQLAKAEKEHRATIEELYRVKMEREQYQNEIRDLQDQLSEMHDELDSAKRAGAEDEEKDALTEDLLQLKQDFQEIMLFKEEQEDMLRRRERELMALKGALKEEVATHDQEVDKLKEQYDKELQKLKTSLAEAMQATPDLLKGQQALSQQTNEETAKQILFNYLKDGSTDNDDTTKKKVNLVFEKIQTLKSRAAGSVQADNKFPDSSAEVKALQEKQTELEKQVTELKRELEQETKNQQSLTESNAMTKENMKDLQKNLEESLQESNRLREQLAKAEKEHRATIEDCRVNLSRIHKDLLQLKQDFQEIMLFKEEQEDMLRRRERELTALKGALKEEVATHDQEVDKLKEQYDKELQKLKTSLAEAMQFPDSSAEVKALQEKQTELEKQVTELKRELEQETKNQQSLTESNAMTKENMKDLQKNLEESLQESNRLREQLAKAEKEHRATIEELYRVKMEREQYQNEIRDLQDQLSEMHDELDSAKRAGAEDEEKDALTEDLLQLKQDFQEIMLFKEEQEDMLRRRERELTALKGALKEEVATHDQEVDKLKEQYDKELQKLKTSLAEAMQFPDSSAEVKALQEKQTELEKQVTELKRELEQETKNQQSLTESNAMTKENMKDLQKNLEESLQESNRLREQLAKAEKEHRATIEDCRVNLSRIHKDLLQLKQDFQEIMLFKEEQEDMLRRRERELTALKGALKEEVATHDQEVDKLKEQYDKELQKLKTSLAEAMQFPDSSAEVKALQEKQTELEKQVTELKRELEQETKNQQSLTESNAMTKENMKDLQKNLEESLQESNRLREQLAKAEKEHRATIEDCRVNLSRIHKNNVSLSSEKVASDEVKNAAQNQVKKLMDENERLRRKILALEAEAAELNKSIDEMKREESCAKEKMDRLEKEKKQLEEALGEVNDQEEALSVANRVLESRLEDVQRSLSKMTREHQELSERLKEEKSQKEQFKRTKNEVEDERRHLDRTIEKLQKEMNEIVEASQRSALDLQVQIDEYKEKNRKEMTDLQRQLRDKSAELEKSRLATKKLQDEMCILAEDLKQCKTERDEAVFRGQHLEQKVYDLEVESKSHVKDDRSRQIKLMEGRISQLETDLDEERNSGELLMDRVDRGREQLEQMRNELLQERAARQDLECDKTSLERQNKDLRSRVAHLEGFQRSNKDGVVSQLESRLHELEDRLEGEERERANLQLANRRLERKVKELMMQVDDEHTSLMDQKDQLQLRLKTMKRQMDEAEEEIERLEHGKKKLQRDLDEQIELHDQLQGQLKVFLKMYMV